MMDLGLIIDTVVEPIRKSPSGSDCFRSAVQLLPRKEEASKILVEALSAI